MPSQTYLHGAEVMQIDSGPRPIETVRTAPVGIIGTAPDADPDLFPLNQPVLIPGMQSMLAGLGVNGTIPKALARVFHYAGAMVSVTRVAESNDIDTQLSNIVGSAGTYTGLHSLLRAEAEHGVKPKLIMMPGFTAQRPGSLANPAVTTALGIAEKLKAMVYASAPADTDAHAVAWKADFSSKRLYAWAPLVKVWDTTLNAYVDQPAEASIIGTQVWLDHHKGFHWSPSNKPLTDIGGTSRPIEFRLDDPASQANYLNEERINTVVRYEGWRSWGNRTCSPDTNWIFASSVRICDAIDESILRAALPWVDQPLGPELVKDILESCQAYLDVLVATGAILRGARAWIETDNNQPSQIALGTLRMEYSRTPSTPLEHLIYGARVDQTHYGLLIQDVIDEIGRNRALAA